MRLINRLIVLFLVITLFAGVLLWVIFNEKVQQQAESEQELIAMAYQNAINYHHKLAELFYDTYLNTRQVKQIIAQANHASAESKQQLRDQLYQLLLPTYHSNQQRFYLKQLHFHLKNNESFLRFHRPHKFGDDLSQIRKTVQYVNETHQSVQSFEEGRIYNGYRFVFPLNLEGNHLGSVETSISMQALMEMMTRQISAKATLILKKSVIEAKVFKNEQSNYTLAPFSDQYYLEKTTLSQPFNLQSAQLQHLKTMIPNQALLALSEQRPTFISEIDQQHFYITSFYPIQNELTQQFVGYLILQKKRDELLASLYSLIGILFLFIALAIIGLHGVYRYQLTQHKLFNRDKLLVEVQEIAKIGTWEVDAIHNEFIWSQEAYKIFAVPANQKITLKTFYQQVHPDDRDKVRKELTEAIAKQKNFEIEHRIRLADGSLRYVKEYGHLKFNAKTGALIKALGIINDITERQEINQQLTKFIDTQTNLIFLTGKDQIEFTNQAVLNFFGYSNLEELSLAFTCISDLFQKEEDYFYFEKLNPKPIEWIEQILTIPQTKRIVLIKDQHGTPISFSVSISPFDQEKYIISLNDITATFIENKILNHQVEHDPLTNTLNRTFLERYFSHLSYQSRAGKFFAFCLFDIDFFKKINDDYSHLIGDEVLIELCELVQGAIRTEDRLVRWGGEEFIIILQTKDLEQAKIAIEHLRQKIAGHSFKSIQQKVTCSFGLTPFRPQLSLSALFDKADQALYQAKNQGRNQVKLYE